MRNHGIGKLLRGDERALQVDVRIDKAGQHKLAAHVDLRFPLVMLAHAGDQPLGHGNVAVTQLVAEDVHIGRVFENKVGLLPSRGHLDDVQLLVQLAVDLACIAFPVCHVVPSLLILCRAHILPAQQGYFFKSTTFLPACRAEIGPGFLCDLPIERRAHG